MYIGEDGGSGLRRFAVVIGVVLLGTASVAVAQLEVPIAVSVLSRAEIEASNIADVASLLEALPGVSRYRFGDNPQGVATIRSEVVPLSMPDALGAVVLDPGSVGFGDFIDVVRDSSATFVSAGNGLGDDLPAAFFIASMNSPSDLPPGSNDDLFIQTEFVIGFDAMPGWQALPAYPGDTWQGGSLILSGMQTPGEPPELDLIDANNEFASVPFDGFFAYHEDWIIAAVDLETLESYGGMDMSFGYAVHAHDGSYGGCEDCASTVTAYPPFPRSGLMPFPGGPFLLEFPVVAVATTTAPTATTEAAVTTAPPATTAPAEEEPTDPGGSLPWGPIGLGALLLAGLVFAVARRNKITEDCDPLLRAWQADVRSLAIATEFLESAAEALNARMLHVASLEELVAQYSEALDGPRGGIGGLDMVRLEGDMIGFDALTELRDHAAVDLASAQAEADEAKAKVNERLAAYQVAVDAEEASRAAYEACVNEKMAAANPPPAPPTGPEPPDAPTAPPSAPAVLAPPISSTPRKDAGCDAEGQPAPVLVPVGPAAKFRLYRDFDIISAVDEASAHGAHEFGNEMATGLRQAGLALGTLGAVLSGKGAAGSGVAAARGFQSGTLVKGSLQAVKGTVSALDATSVIPPVPTSLPEAIVVGLAATANLGALIAGKVTEWMGDNNLIQVRSTYYYQEVSIQPTQIWECEGGVWRCRTVVNIYTVGGTEALRSKAKPFTVKGDADKRSLSNHIKRLAARGRSYILNSAKAIAEWEADHSPGDCQ